MLSNKNHLIINPDSGKEIISQYVIFEHSKDEFIEKLGLIAKTNGTGHIKLIDMSLIL